MRPEHGRFGRPSLYTLTHHPQRKTPSIKTISDQKLFARELKSTRTYTHMHAHPRTRMVVSASQQVVCGCAQARRSSTAWRPSKAWRPIMASSAASHGSKARGYGRGARQTRPWA
eukprot:359722-Chlamydomonas_euryale.AAC.6